MRRQREAAPPPPRKRKSAAGSGGGPASDASPAAAEAAAAELERPATGAAVGAAEEEQDGGGGVTGGGCRAEDCLWRHLNAMSNAVHAMRASDVKNVMAVIRTAYLAADDLQRASEVESLYFPRYGLTAGEFATLYVLNMPGKPSKKRTALQNQEIK